MWHTIRIWAGVRHTIRIWAGGVVHGSGWWLHTDLGGGLYGGDVEYKSGFGLYTDLRGGLYMDLGGGL